MNKTIGLTFLGLIQGLNASYIQETPLGTDQCIGKYEKDLSALFVDCYDKSGTIQSKEEFYYQDRVEKECGSQTYDQVKDQLDLWYVPTNFTDDANLTSCDYFEWGNGYLFTEFDSAVGTVVLTQKRDGERSKFFENLKPVNQLTWNWDELNELLFDTCPTVPSGSGSADTTWKFLNISNSDW